MGNAVRRVILLIFLTGQVWFFLGGSMQPGYAQAEKRQDSELILTLPEAVPVGQRPVIQLKLLNAINRRPVPNKPLILYVDGQQVRRIRSDEKGEAVITLGNQLPAGSYKLEAVFDGTEAYNGTRTTAQLIIRPAVLSVQTFPVLPGLVFLLDGKPFVSGEDGFARIEVERAGEYTLEATLPEWAVSGADYRIHFDRWGDDQFKARRQVKITEDRLYQAGFAVFHSIRLSFVDLDGEEVKQERIDTLTLKSSFGALYKLEDGRPYLLQANRVARRKTGLEATPVQYAVENVIIDGTNVVNQAQQRYLVSPGDVWLVELLLYYARIEAKDALFGTPAGTELQIEYPNDKVETYTFGPDHTLTLGPLARGLYHLRVIGVRGMAPRTPVALSQNQEVELKVLTALDMGLGLGLGVVGALGLLFYGRPQLLSFVWRRRHATTHVVIVLGVLGGFFGSTMTVEAASPPSLRDKTGPGNGPSASNETAPSAGVLSGVPQRSLLGPQSKDAIPGTRRRSSTAAPVKINGRLRSECLLYLSLVGGACGAIQASLRGSPAEAISGDGYLKAIKKYAKGSSFNPLASFAFLARDFSLAGGITSVPAPQDPNNPIPLMAYYYIWYTPESWNRAKTDYPTLGRYSSDDRAVMEQHVRWARQAGIQGFIVSWKSTMQLDRRLEMLMDVAAAQDFHLWIIYQGLDFQRSPLPVIQIDADFEHFLNSYAGHPAFEMYDKPVIIWSGTWEFSPEEIERVTSPYRQELLILASERNVEGYQRLARSVDGNAYYWSSVNPDTFPGYAEKLSKMSAAVHANGGLWVAPAAPGFDARLVGGKTVVERAEGETLRRELQAALGSNPDAIGLISWNEFSENSHIEPSQKYGTQALDVLADIRDGTAPVIRDFDSSAPGTTNYNQAYPIYVLIGLFIFIATCVVYVMYRK